MKEIESTLRARVFFACAMVLPFVLSFFVSSSVRAAACEPFLLRPDVKLPEVWRGEGDAASEDALVSRVAGLKGQESFAAAYWSWLQSGADGLGREERLDWLHCTLFYLRRYTDAEGRPSWTPLVDGSPSRTLLPVRTDPLQGATVFPSKLLDPRAEV